MATCAVVQKYAYPLVLTPIPSVQVKKTFSRVVVKCSERSAGTLQMEAPRRSASNYAPTICSDDFIQSLSSRYGEEKYKTEVESLMDYTKGLLVKEKRNAYESLELIDTLQRLGLGYLFADEFKKVLEDTVLYEKKYDDQHYSALRLRILRQHGYMISQDELTPYLDKKTGAFMEDLKNDTKAILSLYDASYLSMEGETLLDDARTFSSKHLREYLAKESTKTELHNHIKHGLEIPYHLRNRKLDARWFISEYDSNKTKNPKLLRLAKLVHNISQAEYQSSVKATSKWWKDHKLPELLPFTRDRLPECLLWSLGFCSQPQYDLAIQNLNLVNQFITTIDDIYDVYGTVEELELFTNAVDRWDLGALDELPEYMRPLFLALYNFVGDVGYNTLKQRGSNIIPILSKLWADLCKGYLVEAKWFDRGYTPNFNEYMDTAFATISIPVIIANEFFLMNEEITEERLDLLKNYGELSYHSGYAFRLVNDLGTSKEEVARGDVSKAILSYMHDKGVSEEEAILQVNNLISESWKKLNKLLILGSPFRREFVIATLDFLRTAHWYYLNGDGFGTGKARTVDMFNSLVVEPIPFDLVTN